MELDSSKVEKKIEELRETKSCSQSTLMGLCEDTEYSQDDLSKIASGFSGGIGGTFAEGSCGAVTGATLAIGLLEEDEDKIKAYTKEMFEAFKDKYTSVRCDIISKNGEDKTPCTECCVFAGKKVCDLINK